MTSTAAPQLEAIDLEVRVGGKLVCRQLDLQLRPGEIWSVLGENGVGKSTLMATLAGMRPPERGQVLLAGKAIHQLRHRARAHQLAWLTQQDDDPFPATVLEKVLVGRHPYLDRLAWESAADEAIACDALAQVDLGGLEARDVTTLSGGERRRVALSAVLAQRTPLLLLDEPLAQIDVRHQLSVLGLLSGLAAQRRTIMFITHEPNQAARFATHALLLFGAGSCLAGPIAQVLNADSLSALYHCRMEMLKGGDEVFFVPRGVNSSGVASESVPPPMLR